MLFQGFPIDRRDAPQNGLANDCNRSGSECQYDPGGGEGGNST
jgi:hypothetical protein